MVFEIHKQHKLCDQLEERAYEWVVHDIEQAFDVSPEKNEWGYEDIISVLNEDNIITIETYLESDEWIEMYVRSALQGIVDRWYSEQPNPDDDEGYYINFSENS